jgi:hypothetical protein
MKAMCLTRILQGLSLAAVLLFHFPAGGQGTTGPSIPVVTIQATIPIAHWNGDPGVFTIFRSGDTSAVLNVWTGISGTASNGVDYQAIGSIVQLASGVTSNSVVIKPINTGQTTIKTVTLNLNGSPLMIPVNYQIGSPSIATVDIAPAGVTNFPPVVNLVVPTNGEVYQAPADIGLIAKASDLDCSISNVEFFAGTNDLGSGVFVILDPILGSSIYGPVYLLDWNGVAAGDYSLTAVATDTAGLSTTSAPVDITVVATNVAPVVRITSPPNGAVFRAPINIPLFAYAADPGGAVTSVEFLADGSAIGYAHPVTAVPPPLPPGSIQPPILIVEPTNYWELFWTNPPVETNITLTADATDSGGVSTVSSPVHLTVLPPLPPPTNFPALIGIVATDPVAIEGTNCWPWLGLVDPVPTWSNWVSPAAVFCRITNCGPKNATFTVFRCGETNDDLLVNYGIGGTATNGIDYAALPGDVTIPAGQRAADISIVPLDDGPPDRNSTIVLRLQPGTNYLVGFPVAAAAIILDSQSPRATTGVLAGNLFHLCANGPDGAWFHVEYTTDLVHWTPVWTNQVVNGCIDFIDPDAGSQPARFYRTVPESGPPE